MAYGDVQLLALQELSNTAASDSATFGTIPNPGSTVVIPVTVFGGVTVTSVQDNHGNNFAVVSEPYSGGQMGAYQAHADNIVIDPGETDYTVQVNFAGNAWARWSGIIFDNARPVTSSPTNSAEGSSASPQVALTVPADNCFVVAVAADAGGILVEPGGWTRIALNTGVDIQPHSSIYSQVDTGTSTPTWSHSNGIWAACGIVLEQRPEVTGPAIPVLMHHYRQQGIV